MIKKFLNWIKNIFKPQRQEIDAHEVMLHPRGFCSDHNKYKHRCPKCRELARMA